MNKKGQTRLKIISVKMILLFSIGIKLLMLVESRIKSVSYVNYI